MATVVSQHVRHLGFFKNYILRKTSANFTENSRKHVFAASNRNIIKKRVYNEFSQKLAVSISNFNWHN